MLCSLSCLRSVLCHSLNITVRFCAICKQNSFQYEIFSYFSQVQSEKYYILVRWFKQHKISSFVLQLDKIYSCLQNMKGLRNIQLSNNFIKDYSPVSHIKDPNVVQQVLTDSKCQNGM
ncbi:Hypothetical_protein [Hexamita inflata]|uniref:Hypothetical_protein n=1 Tax=Hexamita inflata TaxID=28002 RepID=A0AA86UHD0_9EUKA|nr:Hypothetical protein HINF_LOCUS39601 [Hexamita inflata]